MVLIIAPRGESLIFLILMSYNILYIINSLSHFLPIFLLDSNLFNCPIS
jgi:hypothetical protein